jgi:hypothetical protein
MRQLSIAIIMVISLNLLAFEAHSSTATVWYDSASKALDGPDGKSGLKGEMKSLRATLNRVLNPETVEKLLSTRDMVDYNQFLANLPEATSASDRQKISLLFDSIDTRIRMEVLPRLNEVIRQDEDYTDAYLKLAEVYLLNHQEKKAIDAFKKGFNLLQNPTSPESKIPLDLETDFDSDRAFSPLSVRKLVYDIAEVYTRAMVRIFELSMATTKEELDGNKILFLLRQKFAKNDLNLSEDALIRTEKKDKRWRIDTNKETYLIRQENSQLIAYFLVANGQVDIKTGTGLLDTFFGSQESEDLKSDYADKDKFGEAERAAVELILRWIEIKKEQINQDKDLSASKKTDQDLFYSLEVVRFFLHIGQREKAEFWLAEIENIRKNDLGMLKKSQNEIATLKKSLENYNGRVLLSFSADFDARIRLLPTDQVDADQLAISYSDEGIQIRPRLELPLREDGKHGTLSLKAGNYAYFLDNFDSRALKDSVKILPNRQLHRGNIKISSSEKNQQLKFELYPKSYIIFSKILAVLAGAGIYAATL